MAVILKILGPILNSNQLEGPAYIQATTAIGSSGGSAVCFQETINALEAVPTPGFAEAQAYIAATTAAGSSGGSTYCAEQFFAQLENIE